MLQTKKIERDWILVTYDVHADDNLRERIRFKLLKEMGAIYQNDSVYLVPKKVHSANEIKKWGENNFSINLVVFGLDATLDDCKGITKRYVRDLRDRKKKVAEDIEKYWEQIVEVEEGDRTFSGFHNKVKNSEKDFDELKKLINLYGNKHDEFKVESLWIVLQKLKKRYQRFVDSK